MSNPDNSPDAGEPIHRQQGYERHLCSFVMNGQTVLFDAASTERWMQSDTTIDLADKV